MHLETIRRCSVKNGWNRVNASGGGVEVVTSTLVPQLLRENEN